MGRSGSLRDAHISHKRRADDAVPRFVQADLAPMSAY